jgi:gliding motility-associated-like protein
MLKIFLTILITLGIHFFSFNQWNQKGLDIDGETAGDRSGWSVSMGDVNTIAIGDPFNDDNGTNSGQVRIFEWNGFSWIQKGLDLNGDMSYDNFGWAVSMPDNNTVAISAHKFNGNSSDDGLVRIFQWNGTAWIQKGTDIFGEASGDNSGYSVSMPDNNTVAIGAPQNDGNGLNSGHVRIYEWNGSSWIQKGIDIDGEAANDKSGQSLSMPDKNTVAIGAIQNDGNGSNSGHVRIYKWDGVVWSQKGGDIDGESANDNSGQSVSMPTNNIIAIGANQNDGNGINTGHVRIYQWNGLNWVQKGTDIDGETSNDQSGWSVSMPTTNTVAIGAYLNNGIGTDAGHVRVYDWSGSIWVQKGADIDGENANDRSGWSVSMPTNSTVGIGAPQNDGNATDAGHVRIYSYCTPSTGTDTQVACDSYTWIDGNTYTSSNNTATHTIVGGAATGCDSIVTLDLTVNYTTTGTDTQVACDSYTWIDGNTYTSSNNTATHTIVGGAATGCDSIVTLDLTINYTTTGTDTQVACDSYTWIDGNTYTSSNNTATHTIVGGAATGCDSIVTLDLTINYTTTGTDTQVACDSYTWIDGNTYTSSNNTATHTLTNSNGCDSIVTLDLTVNYTTTGTDTQVACDSYTWIDGNTYTSSNNTATHTLTNSNGCDSIVTLDLTVNYTTTGVDIRNKCNSFTWYDGNTYTSSNNTATYTIIGGAATGCDSIVTLDLTIIPPSTGTDYQTACESFTWIDGNTYTSDNNTATYTYTNSAASGCDSIVTLDLTILQPTLGVDVQTSCEKYTWIDGNIYTSDNNSATYTIPNGASNGCDSIITLNLTILPTYNTSQNIIICNGQNYSFNGNTYSSTGSYNDTLSTISGCDSIITTNLTELPPLDTTVNVLICYGDSYTIGSNTYTLSGNYIDGILSVNGCDSIVYTNLFVMPEITNQVSHTMCQGESVNFNGTVYYNDTTFIDTLTAINGCDSILTVEINVTQFTTSAISEDSLNVCYNDDDFNLIADNPGGIWTGVGVIDTIAGIYSPNEAGLGSYIVYHHFSGYCGDLDSIKIIVNQQPVLEFETIDDICDGEIGEITALSPRVDDYSFNWNTGDTTSYLTNVLADNYTLIVSDLNGCTETYQVTVNNIIEDCRYHIYLPNTFSPNNDGENDVLYLRGRDIESFTLQIYNRWGNKIFETDDINTGWDGTFKGNELDPAVFVYILRVKFTNGAEILEDGNITIIK